MFRPYHGAHLASPFPLHLGLNYCSHSCFYCFANLNQPARRMDGKSIRRMLGYLKNESTTIEADLLRQGYSVLCANDSDPCAKSNADQMREALPILMDRGITFGFQTKGGDPEVEAMICAHPPTMVYISLTSDDDALLSRAEPGAPGFEQRMDLAKRAADAGHIVVAGINPMLPGWWEDFPGVVDRLNLFGVRHAWLGRMHLNSKQAANIGRHHQLDFSGEIHDARKRMGHHYPPSYIEFVNLLREKGFALFGDVEDETPGFWSALHALPTEIKLVNTWNDVLGWLIAEAKTQDKPGVAVTFSGFAKLINAPHQTNASAFKEYIRPMRRTLYDQLGKEPVIRSIDEVNRIYWRGAEFPQSPIGPHPHVCWPVDDEGYVMVSPDKGGVLVVTSEPTDELEWLWSDRPLPVIK